MARKPVYVELRERLAKEQEGMIPEGSSDGYPTVRFDTKRRQWYHLNSVLERVYHERPVGVEFDDTGAVVRPAECENEEEVEGDGNRG